MQLFKIKHNKSSAVAEIGDRGHNRHGPKRGGLLCPFRGELAWAELYFRIKWRLHPSCRLATIDMGQKLGAVRCALFPGGAGSPSNTKSPGPRPTSIPSGILVHPAVWPQRTLAKNWGLCHFRGEGAGSPSNTMSHRPRSTSVPSRILVDAAVWRQ